MRHSSLQLRRSGQARLASLAALAVSGAAVLAGEPEWRIIRPSNTGIPGEQVTGAFVDSSDRVWVAAHFPFWSEGGVGVFDGARWATFANWETPLPSAVVNQVVFDDSGNAWLGTRNGLAHYHGATGSWSVYTPADSPLPAPLIQYLDIAPDGAA